MAEEQDRETFSIRDLKDLIPTFDGEQALLNDFIEACEFATGNIDEGQERALIFLIKSKLVGKAKTFISSRCLNTWETIKPLLVGHFGDCRDTEALIRDLTNSFQKQNETARNYVQKIETLLTKLRSSVQLDDNIDAANKQTLIDSHERIGLKTLLAGLADPLGQLIRAQRPISISDAAQYILEEENIAYLKSNRHQNQTQPKNPKGFPSHNYNNHYVNPHDRNRPSNYPNRSLNSNSNQNPNADVKFCNYCKKIGHLLENCFKRINNNQRSFNPNSNPSNPMQTQRSDYRSNASNNNAGAHSTNPRNVRFLIKNEEQETGVDAASPLDQEIMN